MVVTGDWFATVILLILLLMSAWSWAIIITKAIQIRKVSAENAHFYHVFLRDQTLSKIYNLAQKFQYASLARMYEVSYREIQAFRSALERSSNVPDARERLMTSLSRSLERVYNQQYDHLEKRLPVLAVISSSAPFIGLFGTVLGIIDAFFNIGTTGVTSLAVVAPGISEALVATAAGLMAAVPALIAYNLFRNRLREISTQMKNFALDITNRLEKML